MRLFIEAVRRRPCLWNPSLSDYRDYAVKDSAWQDVIDAVKMDAISNIQSAKTTWKKLRDTHRDSIKRAKAGVGQTALYGNQWRYAKLMDFLLPFMKHRKTNSSYSSISSTPASQIHASSLPIVPSFSTHDSDHSPPAEREQEDSSEELGNLLKQDNTTKKRKIDNSIEKVKDVEHNHSPLRQETEIRKTIVEEVHPLDIFFKSMLHTTKAMPPWMQVNLKRKIFNIISDAEDYLRSEKSEHECNN